MHDDIRAISNIYLEDAPVWMPAWPMWMEMHSRMVAR